VTAPDLEASEGDDLEVSADRVANTTTGKIFAVEPLPKSRQSIIDAIVAASAGRCERQHARTRHTRSPHRRA